MAVYGPVHILPYDPQCHELFAISQPFTTSTKMKSNISGLALLKTQFKNK
jgi:hypothetical protein